MAIAGDSPASRLLAVSPTSSTLVALDIDARTRELRQTACFAAAPRAGCEVVPALAGASDVAVQRGAAFVAGRDADALAVFRLSEGGLAYAGCASPTLPGCAPAKALDGPVAIATDAGPYSQSGAIHVASRDSDAVASFAMGGAFGTLQQLGCVQQAGGADDCAEGRALADPSGIAADAQGVVVASSGSHGVATLTPQGAPLSCLTQTGAEGCRAADGLWGASGVALHGGDVYVSAPGAGAVVHLRREAGALSARGRAGVPGGAGVALPPDAGLADAPTYAGSHVYVASRALGSVASFARDPASGALAGLPATGALRPGGGIEDVALDPRDYDSVAVYAVGAGGVVALRRNIPPRCGLGFAPPPPVPRTAAGRSVRVALRCHDPNGDALAYSVARSPAHGRVTGFERGTGESGGDAAVYLPDPRHVGPDAFEVRASDGGASATVYLRVEVDPAGSTGRGPHVAILDRRLRMDREGRVRVRLRCPAGTVVRELPANCRGTLRLRRGPRIARSAVSLRRGRLRAVRLRLPRPLRRQVRRARRGLVVEVRVRARGRVAVPVDAPVPDGPLGSTSKRLRLRAR